MAGSRAAPRRAIPAGGFSYPLAISLTAYGRTAVVVGTYSGQVSLISTRTGRSTAPISVGSFPLAVAAAG